MDKNKKKTICLLIEILYILSTFAYLLVIRNIYSTVSNYDFLMFLFISLIIMAVLVLSGPKINRIFVFILSFLYTLYLVSQNIYYRGFSQYYRFTTAIGLSKEVSEVGDSIAELLKFNDFIPFITLILITIIFVVLYFCFQKGVKFRWTLKLSAIPLFIMAFLCLFIHNKTIDDTRNTVDDFNIYKSDFYIYDTIVNTEQFVDKFGLLSLFYRDSELLLNSQNNIAENKEIVDNYIAKKDSVIGNNDMTGIFKDKSLLIVQAESLVEFAIDERLTPNLYYYINNGIKVENFNTPLLIGSTSDTEFMANTSIIPNGGGYPVCYKYINNSFPTTLGNIFKENGYDTYGYHNNYAEYYNRDITFDKYGYEFFDSYKLGLVNLEPDNKLAETIGWILSEKDKYLGYWVTYSGHQPYSLDSVGVDENDVKKIKELYPTLNDEYVSYFAKAMDLDRSLANFINVMDWTGRLDDFVIVLYGDHVLKGVDVSKGSQFDEVFHKNSDDNPEILYTPLFIYANNIERKNISKPSTALDILPTIANLWGFDYDDKSVFGNDIFDESYHGFCFGANGDYITNDFSYNALDDEIKITNDMYDEEKAKDEISKFNLSKDICKKVLELDYFEGE